MSRRRARGRDVHGILLLDKPAGISSNQALQRVKRLFDANKAGHTGSLDPIATGLLPICLGEATKMSAFLLDADKGYLVTVRLGQRTTTGDREGEVIDSRDVPALTPDIVNHVLAQFIGPGEQIPPMYSALKHGGQPLYKLARQGVEVARAPRRITIHTITLRDLRAQEMDLEVHCSKGTYIRCLAEDIGSRLGCGAHVTVLRRIRTGRFTLDQAVTLEQLEQARGPNTPPEALDDLLLPMDTALESWPAVNLTPEMSRYLCQGQAVLVPRAPTSGLVRVYGPKNRFLGIGHVLEDGRVAPKRVVST